MALWGSGVRIPSAPPFASGRCQPSTVSILGRSVFQILDTYWDHEPGRPKGVTQPSPGQRPGKPHPKTPFRPEGADQTTDGLGPPFQGGCDDRHAVPRALPSSGFGHTLRAIRFMVPIRVQYLENTPSHEPRPCTAIGDRGTDRLRCLRRPSVAHQDSRIVP